MMLKYLLQHNKRNIRDEAVREAILELISIKAMCKAYKVPFNDRAQNSLGLVIGVLQGERKNYGS